MSKKLHFENLDGLRFFCFLSVFFYHSFHTESIEVKNNWLYHLIKVDVFGNGNLGVNFFFVLSGFLITYLLIQEKITNVNINIKNFYMRRVLRIWPLFYFCVFFGFVIFPYLKLIFSQTPNESANLWYYLFFGNNFDVISNGQPDSSVLAVLWSLAIEEQFYLVWPIILFLFPLKKMWIPFSFVLLVSIIFRITNNSEVEAEIHTLSCMADLTIGAFGAWVIVQYNFIKDFFYNLSKIKIGLIYLMVLLVFLFRTELFNYFTVIKIFDRVIIALIFLLVILEQNFARENNLWVILFTFYWNFN